MTFQGAIEKYVILILFSTTIMLLQNITTFYPLNFLLQIERKKHKIKDYNVINTVNENIIVTIKMREKKLVRYFGNFSNIGLFSIAPHLVNAHPRATTIAIAIVGREITLKRKPSKKKQRTDTKKRMQRGLRVIT